MKNCNKLSLTILLLSFFPFFATANPNKPLFFMTYKINGDSLGKAKVDAITPLFFEGFSKHLKKEYPCAQDLSISDTKAFVGYSRKQELLGDPAAGGSMNSLSESMGSDYLVVLNIICYYNIGSLSFSATCLDVSKGEKMAMASGISSVTGAWEVELDRIAQQLVYGLKNYEICPYKGTINIQVLTDTTEEKTDEHDVYCSKMDRQYTKTTIHEKKSSANWQLQKNGKYSGDGTIKYAMAEKHSIDERNECFTCEPLITGNRHYTDNTVNYIEIEGLSERNKDIGDYVKYATIRINFKEDSTYTIKLDAASQPGELKTIHEEKAEGDCQNFTKPQELRNNKSNIGLYKTLGPYKGNGLNKVLHQDETFDQIDPITKERTTFKVSFHLKRE